MMNWHDLIPKPDTLPASWWIFEVLGVLTFVVHILFVNVVVGTSILALINRFKSPDETGVITNVLNSSMSKIPSLVALSVTIGVAPLLFVQVLYGTLSYSSSVLMAKYWILVIPILIAGYYGVYLFVHKRRHNQERSGLATLGLVSIVLALLYIGFMLTNNMTLMLQPEKWLAYFENRKGTILNLNDLTVYAKYLHFLTASIAVCGLFSAIIWNSRKQDEEANVKSQSGLRLYGYATMAQLVVGIILILVIPREYALKFMGRNMAYTIVLTVGILTGIVSIVTAMRNRLWLTTGFLIITAMTMGIIRAMLRASYLEGFFNISAVSVNTQYSPMIAFITILLIGLAVVAWMIKAAINAQNRSMAR